MSKYNQLIVKGINNPNGKNVIEGEGIHLLMSNGEYVNGILLIGITIKIIKRGD